MIPTSDSVNTVTPRVFIAATEKDVGKTTTSLGLYSALSPRFHRIGFIKPVGQRFIEVHGYRVDEDSVLIQSVFNTAIPIEHMSPIAVVGDFTRRQIEKSDFTNLTAQIRNSFDRASWEKDFTIIEGSGHAGVGSVFGLSNARVARELASKVVLVTPGGIGRPIDEAALNKAVFDAQGVEVVGVIMNKVDPDKIERVAATARKGFKRIGLELLGIMPTMHFLAEPSLAQIADTIDGRFYCNEKFADNLAADVVIGAVSSGNILRKLSAGTLLIVPGDREDIVLAAASDAIEKSSLKLCGLILSDDLKPHATLLGMLKRTDLPVVFSPIDCYEIARRINSLTVKIQPANTGKIETIRNLVADHVDIPRLLEKIGVPAAQEQ